MNDMEKHNILIIGGPNTGKTHFGIQLYERINSRQFEFKIDPPEGICEGSTVCRAKGSLHKKTA